VFDKIIIQKEILHIKYLFLKFKYSDWPRLEPHIASLPLVIRPSMLWCSTFRSRGWTIVWGTVKPLHCIKPPLVVIVLY